MSVGSISVAEAASQLGVNQARVRAMIAAGLLAAERVGGRWLIDPDSVDRRKYVARSAGRPFSPNQAWGLLMVAAGESPDWLSAWDLSRARGRLRRQGLLALAPRLGKRAALYRLRAHPSDLVRILAEKSLVLAGISAAGRHGISLVVPGYAEFYASQEVMRGLSRRYALQASVRANLLVHVIAGLWPFAERCSAAPAPVVGVDLLDSGDARTRRAGKALLEEVDARWST
jgi:excisionase family DNA binding protein